MHFPTLPSFDFNHDPAPQSLFSLCNHLKLHRSAFADDNPREVLIKPRTLLPNRIRERQTCAYSWLRFRKLYYAHSRDVSIQPIRFLLLFFLCRIIIAEPFRKYPTKYSTCITVFGCAHMFLHAFAMLLGRSWNSSAST